MLYYAILCSTLLCSTRLYSTILRCTALCYTGLLTTPLTSLLQATPLSSRAVGRSAVSLQVGVLSCTLGVVPLRAGAHSNEPLGDAGPHQGCMGLSWVTLRGTTQDAGLVKGIG